MWCSKVVQCRCLVQRNAGVGSDAEAGALQELVVMCVGALRRGVRKTGSLVQTFCQQKYRTVAELLLTQAYAVLGCAPAQTPRTPSRRTPQARHPATTRVHSAPATPLFYSASGAEYLPCSAADFRGSRARQACCRHTHKRTSHTVRAADFLERGEADSELLGHRLLRQVKVLGQLLQFEVLRRGHCAPPGALLTPRPRPRERPSGSGPHQVAPCVHAGGGLAPGGARRHPAAARTHAHTHAGDARAHPVSAHARSDQSCTSGTHQRQAVRAPSRAPALPRALTPNPRHGRGTGAHAAGVGRPGGPYAAPRTHAAP